MYRAWSVSLHVAHCYRWKKHFAGDNYGIKENTPMICMAHSGDNHYQVGVLEDVDGAGERFKIGKVINCYGWSNQPEYVLSSRQFHLLMAGETIEI